MAKKKAKAPAKKAVKKAGKKAPAKKAAKKAVKKVAKKVAKKAKAPKKARKPNPALLKPYTPSAALAAVVGSNPIPRSQVVKKLWAYIKSHGLQDSKNRRMINADEKLKPVFNGHNQVSMFEMAKHLSKHLK